MGLTDRLRALVMPPLPTGVDNFWPYANLAGGGMFPISLNQTMPGARVEEIDQSFAGYAAAFKANAVVFACELARLQLFSEARFQYQRMAKGRPGDLWSDPTLGLLEHPWPGGTTGDLLSRALQFADFAGNAFITRRASGLRFMRPDWVSIILGSYDDPEVTSASCARSWPTRRRPSTSFAFSRMARRRTWSSRSTRRSRKRTSTSGSTRSRRTTSARPTRTRPCTSAAGRT
jgi:hypothetical protein